MSTTEEMSALASHPRVAAALAYIDATDADTLADMIAITGIPAPSGAEHARGIWLRSKLAPLGFDVAPADEVGNIRARRANARGTKHSGNGRTPVILFASHLDTVFSADTDLAVRTDGDRIHAPGISDNGRGVAALIRLADVLHATGLETRNIIELVGTVGEEGAGDLRGVKHLFAGPLPCDAFIAVDGAGLHRIVHRAVGSRRVRITIRGPGGHSWIDRGAAHPVHALASAIALASAHAAYPQSSFSVGRIDGGTGINVIPSEAFADVDIRSEDGGEIARIDAALRTAVQDAVQGANAARRENSPELTFTIAGIGDRPGGDTSADADLVRYAWEATRYCGGTPDLASSSTDANVAMSRGVPAIAIGAGGEAGGMHTTAEWYENTDGAAGLKRLLLLALSLTDVILD